MKELHLGQMSYRELSEWFGYSHPDGFSRASQKAKEKKLKVLEAYANFHIENNKVIIDEIIYPIYSKAFDIIEKEFSKHWGKVKDDTYTYNKILYKERIDTCARVGTEIWNQKQEVKNAINLNTAKSYTNKVKIEQYGHNYLDDHGTKGRSEYVWMNCDGSAPLQGEELNTFNQCISEAYGAVSQLIAAVDEEYRAGRISLKEKKEVIGDIETIDSYDRLVLLAYERLGYMPEKRTKLYDTYEWE